MERYAMKWMAAGVMSLALGVASAADAVGSGAPPPLPTYQSGGQAQAQAQPANPFEPRLVTTQPFPPSGGGGGFGDGGSCGLLGTCPPKQCGHQCLANPNGQTSAEVIAAYEAMNHCKVADREPDAPGACTVTLAQLQQIYPTASTARLEELTNDLSGNLREYHLDAPLRLSHFFAQALEETGGSFRTEENLNYTPKALMVFSYFKKHPAEAEAYGRKKGQPADQEAIANRVYAKRLGNGDVKSGDGWNYRGRGILQTTGRTNYTSLQASYSSMWPEDTVDFVKNPELLEQPSYALRSAVYFWISNGIDKAADTGSTDSAVDSVTAIINKHTKSYANRREHFTSIWTAKVFDSVNCEGTT